MTGLAAKADRLLALHQPGNPVLLANAWDVASATLVQAAGYPAIATTSAAVAESLGFADTDSMDVDLHFAVIARITRAVDVPVTADLEAGYQLPGDEFVARILEAGAVGCNFEDSDHHGDSVLVAAETHAERIRAVRDAAEAAGVHVVINARTDVALHRVGTVDEQRAEILRRGRLYMEAGADCIYPPFVRDEDEIRALVEGLGVPMNVLFLPGVPPVETLRRLGVARISLGSGLFRVALAAAKRSAEAFRDGDDEGVWRR